MQMPLGSLSVVMFSMPHFVRGCLVVMICVSDVILWQSVCACVCLGM